MACSAPRLDTNLIIDCASYALSATEVSLSCLNGNVPEEQLDLFEFTARKMAGACTSAAKVVRRQFLNPCLLGAILYDVPDHPFCYTITPDLARPANTAE